MSGWLIFGAYLLGWLLAIRGSLQRRMLTNICRRCGRETRQDCFIWVHEADTPRGAVRERNGRDVAVAICAAAWWPLRLLVVAFYRTVAALGGGIKTAVTRATPLTKPELERRLAEQQDEIKRLTEQIEAS